MDRRRRSSDRGAIVVRVTAAPANGRAGRYRPSAVSCGDSDRRRRRIGFGASGSGGRIFSAPDNIIAINHSSGRSGPAKTAAGSRREISLVLRSVRVVA